MSPLHRDAVIYASDCAHHAKSTVVNVTVCGVYQPTEAEWRLVACSTSFCSSWHACGALAGEKTHKLAFDKGKVYD